MHTFHSPVDGRSTPVSRQNRGVVDNGAMFGVVNDLHGDILGAKCEDIELSSCGLVLVNNLWNDLTLHTPAGELKNSNSVLFCLGGCGRKVTQLLTEVNVNKTHTV